MARVMVIEDDKDMLGLVCDILSKEHELSSFFDPRLAKLALEPGRPLPEVLLLDVMLPGLDGYSFMNELLADERTREIPVIVMTAKANMADIFRTLPNLAGFLEKPFNSGVLKHLIAQAVSKAG